MRWPILPRIGRAQDRHRDGKKQKSHEPGRTEGFPQPSQDYDGQHSEHAPGPDSISVRILGVPEIRRKRKMDRLKLRNNIRQYSLCRKDELAYHQTGHHEAINRCPGIAQQLLGRGPGSAA